MMSKNSFKQNISKTVSYWLRHAPWEARLLPDESGWVKLSRLMSALDERGINFTIDDLEALNHSTDKVRWDIDRENNRIRASHGHSFQVVAGEAQQPPDTLYHGTAAKNLPAIRRRGILPMNRQFVHLSSEIQTAYTVGKRYGEPFVIKVDAAGLFKTGNKFFHTSDNVWLTEAVPANFLFLKREETDNV